MMQWLNKWQPYVLNALLFDKFIFELAKMFRSFIEECIICTVLNSLGTIHRTWGWWDKNNSVVHRILFYRDQYGLWRGVGLLHV